MNNSDFAARQLGRPPIRPFKILLNTDRFNGEFFPEYAGSFFYVESCDLPCRLTFNSDDESQAVSLTSGLQINTSFSGIKIYHDDYSPDKMDTTEQNPAAVRFFTGGESRSLNQYVSPKIQMGVPYKINVVSTASIEILFPYFKNAKNLNVSGVIYFGMLNPDFAEPGFLSSRLIGFSGNSISKLVTVERNGFTTDTPSTTNAQLISPVKIHDNGITTIYGYSLNVDIQLPGDIDYISLLLEFQKPHPITFTSLNGIVT